MFTSIVSFIHAHPFWATIAAYWCFSAAIDALEVPTEKNGAFYHWAYKFLNKIAGNIFTTFGDKIPGIITKSSTTIEKTSISTNVNGGVDEAKK